MLQKPQPAMVSQTPVNQPSCTSKINDQQLSIYVLKKVNEMNNVKQLRVVSHVSATEGIE
jgi:hypothetical protein